MGKIVLKLDIVTYSTDANFDEEVKKKNGKIVICIFYCPNTICEYNVNIFITSS